MGGKKIFVTGGTGLLGSHLLFSLANSRENVRATYRQKKKIEIVRKVFSYYCADPGELISRIEWVESDLANIDSLKNLMNGSEHVYHCAATVSYESSGRAALIRNNTELTARIVKSCLETRTAKLCHVSSVAAVESATEDRMTDESLKWNDSIHHNAYAVSKYLSEMEVWNAIRKGLNAVIVNPSIILGPGFWDNGSGLFFSRTAKGMLFHSSGVKGYVDVRDVVKSMITLMDSPADGERFIISSENISIKELFSMIARGLNVRRPFISVPEILAGPAKAGINLLTKIRGKEGVITADIVNAAFSKIFYDNSKIRMTTGISFIPVRQAVGEICRIYKAEVQHR